jgi:hypothetical protein
MRRFVSYIWEQYAYLDFPFVYERVHIYWLVDNGGTDECNIELIRQLLCNAG